MIHPIILSTLLTEVVINRSRLPEYIFLFYSVNARMLTLRVDIFLFLSSI